MNDKKSVPPSLAQFAVDQFTTKAPVKSLYVEVLRDEYKGLRARVAELEAYYNEACDDAMDVARELSALKARPSAGVVLPELERWSVGWGGGSEVVEEAHPAGEYVRWEDYKALRSSLNPCRAQYVQRCQCCGYLVTETEHRGCLRSAAVAVPDGYVLVPVEPTPEMLKPWRPSIHAPASYRAMLAAAPSASHTEQNLDMVPGAQQKEPGDE